MDGIWVTFAGAKSFVCKRTWESGRRHSASIYEATSVATGQMAHALDRIGRWRA